MNKKRVALFHPWIKSRGGGEKAILELLKNSRHDFNIYTWVYDAENTFEEFKEIKINILCPRFGQKLARLHILRGLFLFVSLFSKIPLEKYDKFLVSTSGIGEFITFRNYKKDKTYAYVHTPLREASKKIIKWNLKNRYNKNNFGKIIYLISVKFYKIFEKYSWKRFDTIIFNSELSRSRAREDSLVEKQKTFVIYPPVDFSRFQNIKSNPKKYFVYGGARLNTPKRHDLLIKAWQKFSKTNKDYKLIIAGGLENKKYHDKLIKLSSNDKTIDIKVNITNKELEDLYAKAQAGFFLGYQEDLGIAPLEVIASGKPLLAVDEGGYVEIIDKNPLFYKIKEKHSRKEMIDEILKELKAFVNKKRKVIKKKNIVFKDFAKEIDEVLE